MLLDSVIVIDYLNRISAAQAFLDEVQHQATISPITRAEVLAGYPHAQMKAVAAALDGFELLAINAQTADLAARFRNDPKRRSKLKLPDAFQAALATQYGVKLATRNTHDFDPGRDAFVLVPYTL